MGTGILSSDAARAEALSDAEADTELLAQSVAEPSLPRGTAARTTWAPSTGSTRSRREFLKVGDVRRIKIWSADGTIVYSDEPRLIGEKFELGDDELEPLLRRR